MSIKMPCAIADHIRSVIIRALYQRINRIKCPIPGTRPTYSPVNFTRELVYQLIFFNFSNLLVNMLA